MAQKPGLLGHIEGILLLGAGYPHLLPEPGGFLIQFGARGGLDGFDLALQRGGARQPDAAVGLFMGFEKACEFFPVGPGGAFQGRLVPELGKLDGEIDFEPVVIQAAKFSRDQLAGLG